MLSYENNPPDPVKSIGKSTVQHNSSDENVTGNNELPEVEHQLISSSVDAHNFSIRHFVLASRSKDIRTNWPFSEKHLMLCVKHGVKDLLPPFQSKTSKRKQSSTACLEKTSFVDDGIITKIQDEEHSTRVDSLAVCSLGDVALTQEITADHLDMDFDISDKDSEFPSSVTSNSQSYVSRSGGTFKHHKFAKTSAKLSAKKCKLVVKFGCPSVHSSNEETMPHKTNLSDSPASKVCPVCKTFSSSSNTTLNAHIDRCLSMEATSEGMADSKIGTKCKVKPRKMRSMVEICATAMKCTIEDLDIRNGSSRATDLSMPDRNSGVSSAQGNKKKMTSPIEPDKEDNDDGGVYIDANGRKLRILSKMDSFSSVVTTKEDHVSRNPKISKILSTGKKKHFGANHHKYLRLAVSNKNLMAPRAYSSKARSQKSSNDALLFKDIAHNQIKGSTETDESEILRAKGIHQRQEHKLRAVQRSVIRSRKSRLGSFCVENSSSQEFFRDSACLSESRKKPKSKDDILSTKHCLGVKRTRLSMSKYDENFNTDTNGHKRLRKSTTRFNESTCIGKNSTWKPLKQLNRTEKEIDENRLRPVKGADSIEQIDRFLQKSAILHRNNTSPLSQLSVHDPQIWKKTLCLTNEEDHVQLVVEEEEDEYEDADSDEDVAKWHSDHVIHNTVPEHSENYHVTVESRTDESAQDRRAMGRLSKERALNASANTCDEFVDNLGVRLSRGKVVEQERSDIRTDPCINLTAERTMRSFIRSMNRGIHCNETADSYDYQSTALQPYKDSSTGLSSAPRPPNPVLNNGICNYTTKELESNAAQGNRCSDIDPIPIPGPPGSFLPSPGNAETEDYQGNSSSTASVISSHEQGDGNSLASPNSAASSVSNLAAETSEKVAEKLPSTGIPNSSLLGFPIPDSEVSMDKVSVFPQAMKVGASRKEYIEQKSILKTQDDNQPCFCSRKERVSRGSMVDYQETQLLRSRTMSAVVLPTKENISCSLNTAPSYSCAGSDIYKLSSSSNFQVEAIPVLGTPAVGFASPKYRDTMRTDRFHNSGDSESASPSAVLRLMGKNLMVAKNDEELSGPLGDAAPSYANTQMLSHKAASSGKLPDSGYYSQYQRTVPPNPATISPSYRNMRQSLDFRVPNGPWGQINFPRPHLTSHSQAMQTQFHDMHINRGVPDHKWQQCMPSDQKHRSTPGAIDFRKHAIISESMVNALKNDAAKGSRASVVAEQDPSRLIYPIYAGFHPALSSTPIYMQQGPRNTCFPVTLAGPPQMNYSQNVVQGGGSFMTTPSPSTHHQKPGLFYSPKLP